MTRQEAADYLRTTTRTLDRQIARGKVTRYYLGGSASSPRFKREELDNLITDHVNEEAPDTTNQAA